jgi:hypothetical protein
LSIISTGTLAAVRHRRHSPNSRSLTLSPLPHYPIPFPSSHHRWPYPQEGTPPTYFLSHLLSPFILLSSVPVLVQNLHIVVTIGLTLVVSQLWLPPAVPSCFLQAYNIGSLSFAVVHVHQPSHIGYHSLSLVRRHDLTVHYTYDIHPTILLT